jgi:hypothetical protein
MEDPRLGEKWMLIARDAFNGSLLWQRPLRRALASGEALLL